MTFLLLRKQMNPERPEITSECMAIYQASAWRRHQKELQKLALRQQRGIELARKGAQILKEEFGAQRVVLFGSLLEL